MLSTNYNQFHPIYKHFIQFRNLHIILFEKFKVIKKNHFLTVFIGMTGAQAVTIAIAMIAGYYGFALITASSINNRRMF